MTCSADKMAMEDANGRQFSGHDSSALEYVPMSAHHVPLFFSRLILAVSSSQLNSIFQHALDVHYGREWQQGVYPQSAFT
jgi:hypothetical protein